jgi:hypothetical protein
MQRLVDPIGNLRNRARSGLEQVNVIQGVP